MWKLVGQCFDRKFSSKEEIVSFLTTERIGVVDVVQSCERQNGSAADSALKKIEFNPAMEAILKTPSLRRILFTSKLVNHWFLSQRTWHCAAHVEQLVLLSPSPQVSIYISGTEEFKRWKESNPEGDTRTFRLLQYRSAFAKLNEKPNAD